MITRCNDYIIYNIVSHETNVSMTNKHIPRENYESKSYQNRSANVTCMKINQHFMIFIKYGYDAGDAKIV